MLLSILIAIFSAYVAFLVSGRISESETSKNSIAWLIAGSLALGSGVWAMHFIGMLAYQLPLTVNYDVSITILSFFPAVFSSFIILRTSSDQSLTFQTIISRSMLMGTGIALMHYTGMAAMHMEGIMRYQPSLFFLSIFIGLVLSTISLWFKLQADKHVVPGVIFSSQLIIPSIVMGCAISAVHYTGMAAVSVFPEQASHTLNASWTTEALVRIISGITLLLSILLVIAIEVSHRLSLYRRIANSESQVRLLLDSTAEAIYGIDIDGKCTFVNQSCLNMLGYELDSEFLGKDMHELIHYNYPDGSPYPKEKCHIYLTIKNEHKSCVDDEVLWRKNGSSFSCKYWSHPIFKNKKCTGAVITFLDTSEQNVVEETLRRSQKMDALGNLTGGIAHDFNNILAIISGYSELLEDYFSEESEEKGYVKEIYHAADRGKKMTQSLLAFSRKKSSATETLSLNTLLQEERNMLEKTLTARITLIVNLQEALWDIRVNGSELEDAILNLSINAMHAIEGGGQLVIATNNSQINTKYAQLLGVAPGDYVVLSVSDTGCGIDKLTKNKIFEPFFTTKGENGTGLGLSQVYGFIERSNGAIKLDSERNEGSTFKLYFPRYIDDDDTTNLTEEDSVLINGTETIIVVDDEAALVSMASDMLVNYGYHVLKATSAKEAIQLLENNSIDLILTDIIMPEMDGYQLASIVKEKFPSVKIQLVSGYSKERNINTLDKELQENIIIKPYSIKTLIERIRQLLDE